MIPFPECPPPFLAALPPGVHPDAAVSAWREMWKSLLREIEVALSKLDASQIRLPWSEVRAALRGNTLGGEALAAHRNSPGIAASSPESKAEALVLQRRFVLSCSSRLIYLD